MDNRLIEKTEFKWDKRTLLSIFSVLKLWYYCNFSDSDLDIKELLPIEPPNFKILQKFYYEYDKFALINSMNAGFLEILAGLFVLTVLTWFFFRRIWHSPVARIFDCLYTI